MRNISENYSQNDGIDKCSGKANSINIYKKIEDAVENLASIENSIQIRRTMRCDISEGLTKQKEQAEIRLDALLKEKATNENELEKLRAIVDIYKKIGFVKGGVKEFECWAQECKSADTNAKGWEKIAKDLEIRLDELLKEKAVKENELDSMQAIDKEQDSEDESSE